MIVLKSIILLFAAVIGVVISITIGPISDYQTAIVLVDENYIEALQTQKIYTGLLTALITCFVAYLSKASLKLVSTVLLFVGIISVTLVESGEPEFFQNLLPALLDFMPLYIILCFGVMLVFFAVNKKWPRYK